MNDLDGKELDRWITGNWGADNDPEIRRPARPLIAGEVVVATEDFDEFAQIGEDEMTMVTVKAGDRGRLVSVGISTVAVDFDGRTVDIWPHQIKAASTGAKR